MKNMLKNILVSSILLGSLTSCGLFDFFKKPITDILTFEKTGYHSAAITGIKTEDDKLTIPDTIEIDGETCKIETIAKGAFKNNSTLKEITFGPEIKFIKDEAFYNSSITTFHVNSELAQIGVRSFAGLGLNSFEFPKGLVAINDQAFMGNNLTEIHLGPKVNTIGKKAFYLNTGLTTITVDEKNVNYDSRDNSNVLVDSSTNSLIQGSNSAIIPESIETISAHSFDSLLTLEKINIPASVKEIEKYAFYNNPSLGKITVNKYNTRFDSRDDSNAIIRKEENSLFIGCMTTRIPSSVVQIESEAFKNITSIDELTIDKNIQKIGADAFAGWKKEQTIFISDKIDTTKWDPDWRRGCDAKVILLKEI